MQLFKSEWVFEPVRRAGALEWNRPRFGACYGARGTAPVRAVCPPLAALADAPELATIEHEREVLRRLAAYDRAA